MLSRDIWAFHFSLLFIFNFISKVQFSACPRPELLRLLREYVSLISAPLQAVKKRDLSVCEITFLSVLSYVAFDFHKECSHMRWERLQILVDAVAEAQDEYG